MRNREIRDIFFSYFQKKGHHKVLSSPLVPARDPTILFTNAGMNQFKGVFLQEEKREYTRAVSIQKCMRVSGKHNDFDEVGKTEFHHTFFEMMGNFSFGDYFKEEACLYGWELLTGYYKFDPQRLWVSVFEEDDEAHRIWENRVGVPPHKIVRLGEKENFWQMGETGPCGPCSEIHYDLGEQFGPPDFTDQNKRFIEVWNLVFMQYFKDPQGNLNPLPAPSIDTGMGMERLTALLQGVRSNYDTDLFKPIIRFTGELAGIDPADPGHQVGLKVIADHSRALSFLISDGVLPANDGRGYVLRRILRRAAKHGKSLGFSHPFIHKVGSRVIEVMKEFYPELEYHRDFISEVIQAEEERFNRTLANGLKRFEDLLHETLEKKGDSLPGEALFKLSDTYGFPLDFAVDLAHEKDVGIDYRGFQRELEQQKEKSRINLAEKQKSAGTLEGIDQFKTQFTGYDHFEEEATLLAIYEKNKRQAVCSASEDETVLVFDRTPFYGESGGQVGDTGIGQNDQAYFKIKDSRKTDIDVVLHFAEIKKGQLKPGDKFRLIIDRNRRQKIAIHHSATHMLQAALRETLGFHVKQAGSYVGPDKLRFDFTHFKALTEGEISTVEDIINRKIRENIPIKSKKLKYEEAIEKGAIAIFEEKYSDVVRVISLENFSKELCGGTHLEATGEIGIFKIISESSISSGIRRIEAVAGEPAFNHVSENLEIFKAIQDRFRQKKERILDFLIQLEDNLKMKERELKKKTDRGAKPDLSEIINGGVVINDVKTVVEYFEDVDRKQLSALADEIKDKTRGISVLLSNANGKSAIIVSVFQSLVQQLDAGALIKEIARMVDGSGGGRRDFAQAGGKPIVDVPVFKKNAIDIVEKHLK